MPAYGHTAAATTPSRKVKKEKKRAEKLARERQAAGPRFQQRLDQNGAQFVRLVVNHGRVTLSAVDLCELAVCCKGLASGVREFWAKEGAAGAAAMAAATASPGVISSSAASPSAALATSATASSRSRRASSRARSRAALDAAAFPTVFLPASNPLSRLALDYSPYQAGGGFRTRRSAYFAESCAGCGEMISDKAAFVDAVARPCCHSCFSGWGTGVDLGSSPSPRRLLSHLASVLAPTASRLLGVPMGELVRSVVHYSPCRALRGDRAIRVSLRGCASYALRRHGGPANMRKASEMMQRAESSLLASLSTPRGPQLYESLDAFGKDCRKAALKRALTAALAGKEGPHPHADYNVPWSLEQHGGDALVRAAAAYAACGRPSLEAIVATALEAARLAPLKRGSRPALPRARRDVQPLWLYEQQVRRGSGGEAEVEEGDEGEAEEGEEEEGDEDEDKSGSDEEEEGEKGQRGRGRRDEDDESETESETEEDEDDDDDDDDDDWGGGKKKTTKGRGRGKKASPAKKKRKGG